MSNEGICRFLASLSEILFNQIITVAGIRCKQAMKISQTVYHASCALAPYSATATLFQHLLSFATTSFHHALLTSLIHILNSAHLLQLVAFSLDLGTHNRSFQLARKMTVADNTHAIDVSKPLETEGYVCPEPVRHHHVPKSRSRDRSPACLNASPH